MGNSCAFSPSVTDAAPDSPPDASSITIADLFAGIFRGSERTQPVAPGSRTALVGPPPGDEVILDDRERASGLAEAIENRCGIRPRIERLEVGDILVRGRYLIERKEAADFAASVVDGRWKRQLGELRRQRYEPIFLLEGRLDSVETPGLSLEVLQGALLSVALDWQIPVLRTGNVNETAGWVRALLVREQRGESRPDWRLVTARGRRIDAGGPPARPRRAGPASPEVRFRNQSVAILSQVEGVGETKARALIEKFGTIGAVARASHEELATVPHIGSRLAARIREALTEGPPEIQSKKDPSGD